MALLRIRTEIEDRPGRLAMLTAALAARGANILDLSVQVGTEGVVDEFVVDCPTGTEPGEIATALETAGGARTAMVPARAHELTDEPTRVLTLVARLNADPRGLRALPPALAELLRADEATWVTGPASPAYQDAAPDRPDAPPDQANGEAAQADGEAAQADGEAAQADGSPADGLLTVPVGHLRAVRLRRAGLPFTATEAARADALVRAVLRSGDRAPNSRRVGLRDGTQILVRPYGIRDHEAVRAMHERCSLESRRLRYFSVKPFLPQRVLNGFAESSHGLTLVAEGPDGSILALAHLMHVLDPGVAELAFLVEDDWQGRGLGRSLAELLLVLGRERGMVELRATVLSENARVRRLLTSLGGRVRRTEDPAMIEVKLGLGGRQLPGPRPLRSGR